MGEMAEDAMIEAMLEELEMEYPLSRFFETKMPGGRKQMKQGSKYQKFIDRHTEDILNSKRWVTADGEILEIESMGKDHIRNVLQFLYKRKDRYWLNCRDGKLIEKFENGEDFFQRVIRVSTLWAELIRVLTDDGATGFNFEIERR